MFGKLLKDPLLHFVLVGACLFGAYEVVGNPDKSVADNVIVVDRGALLTFIQFRSKEFQPEMAAQRLDGMTAAERDQLVRDFVREEALFREARTLGMSEDDYIIRRRSVQKMEFIAQGMAEQVVTAEADKVEAYFASHREDYFEQPSYTFTHVFLKAGGEDQAALDQRAAELLQQLNGGHTGFSDAAGYGDRFLYHRNYVERTPEFVASHFGAAFEQQLSSLTPSQELWQGPIDSAYGKHLVMLSQHLPGRVPQLSEIRPRVEQDYLRWAQQQKQELAIQQIVEQYDVENRL